VVTKDVAPYTIVAGCPAKPIRDRQPPAIADRLIALAWWDWDHARLRDALEDFRALKPRPSWRRYETAQGLEPRRKKRHLRACASLVLIVVVLGLLGAALLPSTCVNTRCPQNAGTWTRRRDPARGQPEHLPCPGARTPRVFTGTPLEVALRLDRPPRKTAPC
jgi:hypothetical protein